MHARITYVHNNNNNNEWLEATISLSLLLSVIK